MTETLDLTLPDINIEAEQAVIGAMLRSRDAVNTARLELTIDAFYRPWHAELFARICELEDRDIRADAQVILTDLAARKKLGTDGTLTNALFDMWAGSHYASNIDFHTASVRSAARVRALQAEHARLGQALTEAANGGDQDVLLDAAAQHSLALQLISETPDSEKPIEGLTTWDTFVRDNENAPWVVPGLMRRHDVIMILAAAGAGKSFLSRQVCTTLAAGIHPFTLKPVEPVRTLLVDLENAPDQVAEESAPLLGQVHRLSGRGIEDRGWVWMRTEGLDLRHREDAQLLERVIAETHPQVVALGSLYNAYLKGRDDWDTAAMDVQAVLKKLRTRYNLTFWLEHHMPRAPGGHTGTPYGGTSWKKWPTHGRVLRKACDKGAIYLLESGTFRGDRGQRDGIPLAVQRGGRLPYTAIFEPGELEILIEASS